MRAIEFLAEKRVESAWITDLIYTRPTKTLTMQLSNGRRFSIKGISRSIFERWIKSPSKGRFFHQNIRTVYDINRIK